MNNSKANYGFFSPSRRAGVTHIFSLFAFIAYFFFVGAVYCSGAEVSWINPNNGNWNNPANWSTGTVPLATDNVSINVDGTYIVTVSSNISAASIAIGGGLGTQTLVVQSATVNAAVINKGTVNVRGASALSGSFENQAGAVLTVEGTSSFGYGVLTFANGFNNYGTIQLTNTHSNYQATLAVTSGTLTNHGTIKSLYGVSGGYRYFNAALDNQGTLQLDHQLTINKGSATHTNSGTINVNQGSLALSQSGTGASFTNTGTLNIAAGKSVSVAGGLFTPGNGVASGLLNLNSATLGAGTVSEALVVTMDKSNTSGAVVNKGTVKAHGTCGFSGSFENQAGAVLTVEGTSSSGYGVLTLANGFNNYGTIQLTNTHSNYQATLAVTSGTLTNHGTIKSLYGVSGGYRYFNAALDNQGTLQLDHQLTINKGSATHTNSGTINVNQGSLALSQSGTGASFTNTGTLNIAAGKSVSVTGGLFTPGNGVASGLLNLNSATLGAGTISQALVVTMDKSNTSGAVVNKGTIKAHGTCGFSGSFENQAGAVLTVEGTSSSGYGVLTLANGFNNYGTIQLTNTHSNYQATLAVTSGTLTNHGTIKSLYGVSGGYRYLNAALDNRGTLQLDNQLTINKGSATHTNSGTINVNQGSLAISQSGTGASFTNTGTLNIAAGKSVSVTGGLFTPGNGVASGLLNLNSATLGAGTISQALVVTMDKSNTSGAVVNKGTIKAHGTCGFSGSFENQAGAVLTVEGTSSSGYGVLTLANGFNNYGTIQLTNTHSNYQATLAVTSGTLTNHGTIKSLYGVSGGYRYFYAALDNRGTLQLDHQLTINKGSATHTNSGTINVNQGSLALSQSGTGASFTNTGTLNIAAGKSVSVTGGLFTPGNGVASGLLNLNSATLGAGTVSEALVVTMDKSNTSGAVVNKGTIKARGTCGFGGSFENQAGAVVSIEGASSFGHGVLTLANGFNNYGTIQLTNTYSAHQATLAVTSGTLINHGTIKSLYGVSGGERYFYAALDNQGTLQLDHQLTVNKGSASHTNSGTINVNQGSLAISQSGTGASFTNTGTLNIAAGKSVSVTGGLFTPGNGVASGLLKLNSATLGAGTVSEALVVTMDKSNTSGAVVNKGTIKARGTCGFGGSFENQAGAVVSIEGASSFGHGVLTLANGFNNYGTIQLTNTYSAHQATLAVTSGTLINHGTIKSLYGVSGGDRYFYAALDNQGTLQLDHQLQIKKASATHTNSGTVNINSGKTLTVSEGIFRNTPTGYIKGAGTLQVSGSSFDNNGHISPGIASGILSLSGNFNLSPTGSLDIEIGGTSPGIGYDQLKVSGAAALDGILNISLADNFVPPVGSSYQVLTYGSHSGKFSAINPAIINSTLDWKVSYTATGLLLEAVEGTQGLRLHVSDRPDPLNLFQELTYTLTVANNSEAPATNVRLTDSLPSSVLFSSAAAGQGSCTENGGTINCSLGDLGPLASTTVVLKVVPTFVGAIANTASVTSDTADANPTDNAVTSYTTVNKLAVDDDIGNSPFDFGITGLSTNYHVNSGDAAITMSGIGFDGATVVTLVGEDGTVYQAKVNQLDSQFQMSTVFDLSGIPVGRYDVVVTNANGSYTLRNGFEVIPPQPRLETRLVMPASLGRHAVATIYVEYQNTGEAPMAAPLLRLVSADADDSDKPILTLDKARIVQNFWSSTMPAGTGHSVQFLAAGSGDSPGILEPGESGRVPVYYLGMLRPWNFSDGQVELQVFIIQGNDPTPFGWDGRKEYMKPETMPQVAWNVIFANLAAGVGQTWGDYINTLSDNAAFLYRHGGKMENGTGRLMQFELLQAMGHSPITTLESSTDLVIEAPGLPLTFARYSGNSIVKRHKTGPLGKGWVHNWQLAVAEEADGDVVLTAMNSKLLFTLDSRGGYFSPAGLDGRLSKAGDIFTFTANDGVKTVFNAGGSLNCIEDLNGNRITATYSDGLLTTLTHSSGKYLAIGYSGGLISSVTDNTGGLSVAYFYSGTGDSLAAVTDIHGRTTEYAYLQSGMAVQALETVYLPDGTENSYSYDEKGRLSAISFNANPPLTIGYDSAATVTLTDTASGAQYRYYYDDLGQFVEYADPLGATIYADYDANSNLTGLQQPDGKVMAFYYDTKSNLTHLFDQLQQETRFIYGANSRLTSFTNAENIATAYSHDAKGNTAARISPDSTSQTYGYDATGEVVDRRNRRGKGVGYTRDAGGRVTRTNYADGSSISYTYDGVGKLLTITDVTGLTTLDYYPDHLLRRITYPGGRFLEYGYDTAGRRTSLTDQTGYRLNYGYTANGQLESIATGTGKRLAGYSYDAMQRLSRQTLGNGVYTTYAYDIKGRLTGVASFSADGSDISAYDYLYDVNDRRTRMTSRDGVWDYTYDATGQLTRATFTSSNAEIPSRDIGYVYDKVGNRVREIVNGATKDYGVTAMNQYSQAGTLSYTYDPDGNLTGKTDGTDTWAYAYNDDNRLIRSSGPDGEKEYIYNGLGHLAAVIADGVKHDYTVDPFGYGNVMAEYDTAGNLASRYTHGLGLVAKDDNFYTFDGNGNTSEMTNAANEIVNFYLYEPFGKTLYDVETTDNDFQFVGQLGVRQMGDDLVYMRNRFFMPSLGRFFSEDPIGLAGGDVSFYRYVSNDPVNWVDPTGLLNLGKAVAGALTVTDGMTMVGVGIAGTVAAGIASGGNPYVTGAVGLIMVPVVGAGAYDIYHGAHVFWEGLWEKEDDSDCH